MGSLAFRTGVADRVHDVLNRSDGLGWRRAQERIGRGDLAREAPSLRIGRIAQMAMIDALADRSRLQQQPDRPTPQCPIRLAPFFYNKISRYCGPDLAIGTSEPSQFFL